MTLRQFVEPGSDSDPDRSLVVVNRASADPIQTMLAELFEDQPVEVEEQSLSEEDEDVVYLLEDGEVVATSPLAALQEAILLINSDLYVTGTRSVEDVAVPDVVDALDGVRFDLRGYPESNTEKLLLITVSRYIEKRSLAADGGIHRASFQRLSRIDDERGTRAVYERLAGSDTDTHVYGVPDWTPGPEFEVTMHGGWSEDFRDSWFVVHVPEDDDGTHAALVAVETNPRSWDGLWTYDPDRVREINRYIEREL